MIPELVIFVPLEGQPTAGLVCDSYEDEQRLAIDVLRRKNEIAERLQEWALQVLADHERNST